jgi:multiple sugar transport system ATP-binding protein
MTMGDRIVIMKDGSVQQVGEPLAVYEKPANLFVAGFIGSPAMNFLSVDVVDGAGVPALQGPGFKVPTPEEYAARLELYRGHRLTLGIRPEDLRPAAPSDPPETVIDASIAVVEPLGSEQYLELDLGGTALIARLDPHVRVRAHDRIRLTPVSGKIHLFDPGTERSLLA